MDTSSVIEKRYVRGPGADEVLVEYDTTGVSDVRTWLYADERGSVIAGANDSGAKTFINTYDEFGNPASANTGSFQYTGQLWLDEVELYHYKARAYNPELGRFMQTDPIGYGDGMNMYNYTGGDPVNGRDPSGTQECTFGCIPPVVAGRNPVFRGPGPTGTAGDTFQRDLDTRDQEEDYLECVERGECGDEINQGFNQDAFTNPPENTSRIPEEGEILFDGVPSSSEFLAGCGFFCSGSATDVSWLLELPAGAAGVARFGLTRTFNLGKTGYRFVKNGREVKFGNNFRVAPFGNRTGNPYGRFPHYHRRGIDPITGTTRPGQGIGRHRPWETRVGDNSFWDRF